MGKAAWFCVLTLGMGVAACGDDGGSSADARPIQLTDGGTADAAAVACNPVAQTGCMPDEKCATLVESDVPFLARTACVPNGNVPEGGDCVQGDPGATTGYDDCEAGNECRVGICTEICQQAPNSCESGNCVLISTKFQDLEGIGLCAAACDPVQQDCQDSMSTDNACYLNTGLGESSCSRVPEETMGITQGGDCYGPEPGRCYLNGCPEGFGAVLNKTPGADDGSVCAAFCSPVAQDSTNSTNLGGDPNGITCASRGAVSSHCRFISTFYNNTTQVPDSIGMCVDPELWGSCENYVVDSTDPMDFVPGCEPFMTTANGNVPAGVERPAFQGDWSALPQ